MQTLQVSAQFGLGASTQVGFVHGLGSRMYLNFGRQVSSLSNPGRTTTGLQDVVDGLQHPKTQ